MVRLEEFHTIACKIDMCPLCVIRCLFEITVASYWAFEHSGLNWGRSVYVHSTERPYNFIAHTRREH